MQRRRVMDMVVAGLALVLLVVGLAGCGGDDDDGGAQSGTAEVTTLDNTFGDPITVEVGTEVTWVNKGRNDHDIHPVEEGGPGPQVDAEDFGPGEEYSYTFEDEGTFKYYCKLHGTPTGGMTGEVTVGGKASERAQEDEGGEAAGASGNVLAVPEDHETIQGAVDAAEPGDLILVSPGTYEEAVTVPEDKHDIVIRGLDRNETILDGGYELENGILVAGADGVAIENMTAMRYTANGFFWTGVEGYRGSYLSATRNGDYGIYAFDSTHGIFEHSYGSGSPDAGFYIGDCQPCDAVIRDVVSEYNGLGYSGTNAGGNLAIVDSTFRHNRAGIVPNSGSYEGNAPQRGPNTVIAGNLIYSNSNGETPAIDAAKLATGNGILVAGGNDNQILRNRVWDHDLAGIALVDLPEDAENYWTVTGNKVRENVVSDSRLADLGLATQEGDGNCFADNDFATGAPTEIEDAVPCEGDPTADPTEGAFNLAALIAREVPESVDYREADTPDLPELENMPDAATAPARPARDLDITIDLLSIEVPDKPEG